MIAAFVTEKSFKSHGTVKEWPAGPANMYNMKFVTKNLRRLQIWHVVYTLFVISALSSSHKVLADDDRDYDLEIAADTAAEIQVDEAKWAYTKSVRLELARSKFVRVETSIPLDQTEEPRLTLGVAKDVSRNWSINLNLWTSL